MENNLTFFFFYFLFLYSLVPFSLGLLYAENKRFLLFLHYLEITGIEHLRMPSEFPVDFLWFLVFHYAMQKVPETGNETRREQGLNSHFLVLVGLDL